MTFRFQALQESCINHVLQGPKKTTGLHNGPAVMEFLDSLPGLGMETITTSIHEGGKVLESQTFKRSERTVSGR